MVTTGALHGSPVRSRAAKPAWAGGGRCRLRREHAGRNRSLPRRQARPDSRRAAHQAEGKAGLARRRPGQELTQAHQVGVGLLVDPTLSLHDLGPEVAEMRDRAAKAGHAQFGESRQHLQRRVGAAALAAGRSDALRQARVSSCPWLDEITRRSCKTRRLRTSRDWFASC